MKTSHYYSVDGADACIRPTMHWVYKTVESVTSLEFKVISYRYVGYVVVVVVAATA